MSQGQPRGAAELDNTGVNGSATFAEGGADQQRLWFPSAQVECSSTVVWDSSVRHSHRVRWPFPYLVDFNLMWYC